MTNSNTNGLGEAKITLYRPRSGSCSDSTANGTKLKDWSGTITGNTVQTISESAQPGYCFRMYLNAQGFPLDSVQVYAKKY
ncbi:hypothetical protein [Amycolatopsis sp. EV170708-02-1]|uniref:hypothetical protein n=1 Tax=Amycolatopsis sp. EV170708-02-1 TaxID=2919322 RepID=UPI001F0BB059|nr:hypothetical protein [Amycolatopsis sp. EV170708-02-1]UMP06769.1 hypothetical protein MJQ72_19025 [Amycolatopsis sp. EV170708-02-1]